MKVCIVTEEFVGLPESGGIGTAFTELTHLLVSNGADVEVLICRSFDGPQEVRVELARRARSEGYLVTFLNLHRYASAPHDAAKRSFGVYQYLKTREHDVVHFADYLGNGYYSVLSKAQGLAFRKTLLITQVHGPSRWAMLANHRLFQAHEDLQIDFMEREQIRLSDECVAPSRYIVERIRELGFVFPREPRVIKNCCGGAAQLRRTKALTSFERVPVSELVFFGRHEDRKGIALFCDMVDQLGTLLVHRGIGVTFLGEFGVVEGKPSGIFLLERTRSWAVDLKILPDFDRNEAIRYLARRPGALTVMPSVENSPYTVVEMLAAGKAFVTCEEGGAKELIARKHWGAFTAQAAVGPFVEQILQFIEKGTSAAEFDQEPPSVDRAWLEFHGDFKERLRRLRGSEDRRRARRKSDPKVVLGITHHERPLKLLDAIWSAVRQTYRNIEIVVVDDGSRSEEAIAALKLAESTLARVGGRLVRQPNRYLGAARNAVARCSKSDYLIFLDDDNLAKPDLFEKLVTAAVSTGADIVTCMSHFMPEESRAGASSRIDSHSEPVHYCPLGGPLALGPFENCFGDATALIRRKTFDAVGGYTEQHGVGYEDYEFFYRCAQAGHAITVCPEQLYLYEVGKRGMLASGSPWKNQRRVLAAVSPTGLGDSVHAIVELGAGRLVAEYDRGRNRWLVDGKYGDGCFDELVGRGLSTQAKSLKLAALADMVHASRCAEAFRRAASAPEEGDTDCEPRSLPPAILESLGTDPASWKISQQTHGFLLNGQSDAAAQLILEQMHPGAPVSPVVATLLVRLLRYSDYSPPAAFVERIFARVDQARIDGETSPLVWTALALCCIKSHNAPTLALIWNHLVAEEGNRYCARYLDVREAVAAGAFSSALDHFCAHGVDEQRVGFALLSSLADEAAAFLGCKADLLEISATTRTLCADA